MSLVQQVTDLALRIATQNKLMATWINGNVADLSSLNTTTKTNLVAAVNEVKSTADAAAQSGGAQALNELTDVTVTTPATGHLLRHNGTEFVNVLGTSIFEVAGAAAAAQSASQPLDSDLTAIAALSTTTYGRTLLTLADQAALMNLVPNATETVFGKVEIATTAEITTGTADDRVVSALKLQQRLAAYAQPLDTDLTAIAALATTAFGRGLLTLADQAALTGAISAATEAVSGRVELATAAETTTGTDNTRAVHPQGLKVELDKKANTSALGPLATSTDAANLTGTLPTSVLPPLAINDTFPVASQAAMLALTAQRGDVAIRSDLNRNFILMAEGASTLANWVQLAGGSDVLSVAGRTGAVVLTKSDVGLNNVDNTADTAKPVSTAQQTALNAKAPLDSPTFTGTVNGVTKAHVGLGNVDNTSDASKPVSTAQQTALNGKVSTTGNETIAGIKTFSSAPVVPNGSFAIAATTGLQGALDGKAASTHTHTLTDLPDAWVKKSVRLATTANITLTAAQTIDGVLAAVNDRVLVKNQSTPAQNGIYIVSAGAWTRATDADSASEIAGGAVNVDEGSQGGQLFTNTFPATGTVGTTAMSWYKVLTDQTSYALASHNHAGVYEPVLAAGTAAQYYRGDKTWQTHDKASVGLANVDNTSDANKPVSTAQQTAINGRQAADATLTALAGVTTAANQLIYATASDVFATTTLSAFGRTLIDDADALSARTTLDVYSKAEIGNPETNFVAVFEAGLV